jgi:hypothetical protein
MYFALVHASLFEPGLAAMQCTMMGEYVYLSYMTLVMILMAMRQQLNVGHLCNQ